MTGERRDRARGEAAAWTVAQHLSRRLGPGYFLGRGNPGDHQVDVLWFHPRRLGDPHLWLDPENGTSAGDRAVHDRQVWRRVARGEVSAALVADELIEQMRMHTTIAEQPMPASNTVSTLAAIARHSALFGREWLITWGIMWGVHLPSEGWAEGVAESRFQVFPHVKTDGLTAGVDRDGPAGRFWFVEDRESQALCLIDSDGEFAFPGMPPTAWATDGDPFAKGPLATTLIRRMESANEYGSTAPPVLGLPTVLSQFNRKERFWLITEASGRGASEIHGHGLALGEDFRSRLETAVGWDVPEHAWMAMDYHLSWIAGALNWKAGATGPDALNNLPTASASVTGTQEDVDLILAWATPDSYRVLLVEAKGVTAWTNKQATSKIDRLKHIIEQAQDLPLDVEWRYVLASPKASAKLTTKDWPSWATSSDGSPYWLPLNIPPTLVKTQRCDDSGKPSSSGTHWRIVADS